MRILRIRFVPVRMSCASSFFRLSRKSSFQRAVNYRAFKYFDARRGPKTRLSAVQLTVGVNRCKSKLQKEYAGGAWVNRKPLNGLEKAGWEKNGWAPCKNF